MINSLQNTLRSAMIDNKFFLVLVKAAHKSLILLQLTFASRCMCLVSLKLTSLSDSGRKNNMLG